MIDAFNKILTGYTTDTTAASSAAKINYQQAQQVTKKAALDNFAGYADHVYYKDVTTGNYHLVDIVTGVTPAVVLEDFEIDTQSGSHYGSIVGQFVAEFKQKDFSDGGGYGRPQLLDRDRRLSSSTGITGDEKKVTAYDQGTTLSGSDVVYTDTNIQAALDRKATLHNRKFVKLTVDGFKNYEIGQKIEFTSEKCSGWFVMLRKRYNIKNLKTEISGLGVITCS